jgi:hypothetical protein
LNDPEKPTTKDDWYNAYCNVEHTLGIEGEHNLVDYIKHLYIDVTTDLV